MLWLGRAARVGTVAMVLLAVANADARPPLPGKGPGGRFTPRDTGPKGTAPLYLMLYKHHLGGKGAYYPHAAEFREWLSLVEEEGVADEMTFFFDGILVERLEREDPAVLDHIRAERYAIGYHGEDVHGPWPAIEGRSGPGRSLVTATMNFGDAVAAIQHRYSHALSGLTFDASGYVDVDQPGTLEPHTRGGISQVLATFGDVPYVGGTCLSQPASAFAMRGLNPGVRMWQSGGPFSDHFASKNPNTRAVDAAHAYMGADTTVFWYMGRPATRQGTTNEVSPWTRDGRRTQAQLDGLPRREPTVVNLPLGDDLAGSRAFLQWLKRWIAEHPGAQLTTPAEVAALLVTEPPTLDPVAVAKAAAASWQDGPPERLQVGSQAVSLADALEVMARAVAGGSTAAVRTTWVNGPFETDADIQRAQGTVLASDLPLAAATWVRAVEASPWRASPASVSIGKTRVGFHQLYHALATHLSDPKASRITLASGSPWPASVQLLIEGWPHTSAPQVDSWIGGAFWTARPAEWK
jgi:hypothetical protein